MRDLVSPRLPQFDRVEGEAENLQLRAQLMSKIRTEARGMTQAQAAKLCGVTQPRINDLLRGKIEKFSLDALVNMLAAAGLRVEMRVRRAAWSAVRAIQRAPLASIQQGADRQSRANRCEYAHHARAVQMRFEPGCQAFRCQLVVDECGNCSHQSRAGDDRARILLASLRKPSLVEERPHECGCVVRPIANRGMAQRRTE